METRATVTAAASNAIFGKPLVMNVYRSVIVEAMVASALPEWQWCSADYMAYDFIHPDGTRLEVKQSAMKQTWTTKGTPKPSWDIAARNGIWENGIDWVNKPGRNAEIYVLGLHGVTNDTADHRDPSQWRFFVVPAERLPTTKRLSLPAVRRLTDPVGLEDLNRAVTEIRRASADARRTTLPQAQKYL